MRPGFRAGNGSAARQGEGSAPARFRLQHDGTGAAAASVRAASRQARQARQARGGGAMGTYQATVTDGHTGFTGRKWVRWTKKMRAAFLDHLAATCNVRGAAESIGVDPVSVYLLRRREPAFADAWGEALALGYEMLETQLVGHALAGGDPGGMLANGADTRAGPISVDLAMRLLVLHRNADGKPRRGGARPQYATREDTDRVLLAKLADLEAKRARAAAGDAALDAKEGR